MCDSVTLSQDATSHIKVQSSSVLSDILLYVFLEQFCSISLLHTNGNCKQGMRETEYWEEERQKVTEHRIPYACYVSRNENGVQVVVGI